MNIYIGDEDIRSLEKEDTEVDADERLTIVPSIAGESMGDLPKLNNTEIARYSRHLILDEVGMEGQQNQSRQSSLCWYGWFGFPYPHVFGNLPVSEELASLISMLLMNPTFKDRF